MDMGCASQDIVLLKLWLTEKRLSLELATALSIHSLRFHLKLKGDFDFEQSPVEWVVLAEPSVRQLAELLGRRDLPLDLPDVPF